jgi:putative membrane protein
VFRDFVLACLHHLAAFALVAALAIEIALLRPGMDAGAVKRLGRIDIAFGIAALAVLAAGLARVFYGIKGPAYYLGNWVFWTKLGVFALIALFSIGPTLRILAWGRLLKTDPKALPTTDEILRVKRMVHLEAGLVLLLPILGAAMARGYGLP